MQKSLPVQLPYPAENPGYEASNTVEVHLCLLSSCSLLLACKSRLTERQMSRAVVIPASNILLRTVYITTLGTNGADCTRKPERLLPERARWAIPPMASLCCGEKRENRGELCLQSMFCLFVNSRPVDHLTSINAQGCSPYESRLKV
ncbi:uncharacterized protein B0T23DRAFT_378102, partial [Neurospora hispaniola]